MSGLLGLTGTNDGIVSSQHSIRSKVIYYERTTSESDGQEVLTGAGFPPVACIFLGSNQYFGFGGGYAAEQEDGTIIQATSTVYYSTSDFGRHGNENMYRQSAGSGETWYCRMINFTADGANVEFQDEANPSSGLTYAIMWLR